MISFVVGLALGMAAEHFLQAGDRLVSLVKGLVARFKSSDASE